MRRGSKPIIYKSMSLTCDCRATDSLWRRLACEVPIDAVHTHRHCSHRPPKGPNSPHWLRKPRVWCNSATPQTPNTVPLAWQAHVAVWSGWACSIRTGNHCGRTRHPLRRRRHMQVALPWPVLAWGEGFWGGGPTECPTGRVRGSARSQHGVVALQRDSLWRLSGGATFPAWQRTLIAHQ